MSIVSTCPACATGDHERHDASYGITEGLIGGACCECTGDCGEKLTSFLLGFFPVVLADTVLISDHKYFGNVCSGFGDTVPGCRHINWDTGERCSKMPSEHGYLGKHRKEV